MLGFLSGQNFRKVFSCVQNRSKVAKLGQSGSGGSGTRRETPLLDLVLDGGGFSEGKCR
jgi:hypothetical protein